MVLMPLKFTGRFAMRSFAAVLLGLLLAQVPSAQADMVFISPSSPTLAQGASETVSVNLSATTNFTITAVDFSLAFDSTRFSLSNFQVGTFTANFAQNTNPSTGPDTTGQLVVDQFGSGVSVSGNPVVAGTTGSLFTFTLTALPNAPLGAGMLNLQQGFDVSITPNSDLTLSPAPTNAFDPGIDANVTVTGSTVPEPASLVLMGLGGGLAVIAARFGKKRKPATIAAS